MEECTALDWVTAGATVFAAIGTVAAVIVALWLARRDEKLRLRIDVDMGGVIETSRAGTRGRYELLIAIANLGRRSALITSIGWRFGYFNRKYFWQVFKSDSSQKPPTKLSDGENVIYEVSLAAFDKEFPTMISGLYRFEQMLLPRSVRLIVSTAVGKQFVVKVRPLLRKHIQQLVRDRKKPVTEQTSDEGT